MLLYIIQHFIKLMADWGDQRLALNLIRQMSSYTRKLIPVYQAQCQAQIVTSFYVVLY